ncbi:MAG: hypothetical protein ABFC18_03440 [Rikenellaceae bacterium]
MTISKEKQVTLPVWVISGLVAIILSGFTTWGIISAKAATLEVRATHNENNIRELQKEKADKEEFAIVMDMLRDINKKLDEHMKQ